MIELTPMAALKAFPLTHPYIKVPNFYYTGDGLNS